MGISLKPTRLDREAYGFDPNRTHHNNKDEKLISNLP